MRKWTATLVVAVALAACASVPRGSGRGDQRNGVTTTTLPTPATTPLGDVELPELASRLYSNP